MTAEDLEDEHPDVTAERIHRGGYNPAEEDVDKAHSGALPPGWASRQASQPDPHMIREK